MKNIVGIVVLVVASTAPSPNPIANSLNNETVYGNSETNDTDLNGAAIAAGPFDRKPPPW